MLSPDSALEGQRPANKPAQGNALGWRIFWRQALTGRNKFAPVLCSPFRAWALFVRLPRALPWAGLSRTFGAESVRSEPLPVLCLPGSGMRALLSAAFVFALPLGALAQGVKFRLNPAPELNEPGKKAAPEEAQQIAKRAMALMTKGDLAAAKKEFLKVLTLVPGNQPTLINIGLIEYRQRNYGEAENLLRKVIRADPENGLGWLILGVIFYDAGKLDAAHAALAQAAYLLPKDPRAHHYLGVTVGKKGWYSGAEDQMRKAIALEPEYAEAHFNLAVFYLQRNPPAVELARRHYQRALDLGAAPDPDVAKQLTEPSIM